MMSRQLADLMAAQITCEARRQADNVGIEGMDAGAFTGAYLASFIATCAVTMPDLRSELVARGMIDAELPPMLKQQAE